jgi:hypothetical protein
MDDIIQVFSDLSSDDETVRTTAGEQIEVMMTDLLLPTHLFALLADSSHSDHIHVCTTGALRLWFKQCWTELTTLDQLGFIHKLQEFLLVSHPASEHLIALYCSCRTVFPDPWPFVEFLRKVAQLVSVDNDSESVVLAMSVGCVISERSRAPVISPRAAFHTDSYLPYHKR